LTEWQAYLNIVPSAVRSPKSPRMTVLKYVSASLAGMTVTLAVQAGLRPIGGPSSARRKWLQNLAHVCLAPPPAALAGGIMGPTIAHSASFRSFG
jgi:hypothetical protein